MYKPGSDKFRLLQMPDTMLERKLIEQFPPTLFECNPLSEVLLALKDSIFWNILGPLVTMHTNKNNKVMFKNVQTTQRCFNVLYS